MFSSALILAINDLSELSPIEYISLIASFHVDEKKQIDTSRYTPKQLAQIEKTVKSKGSSTATYLNVRFTRPLSDFELPGMGYLFGLYNAYRDHGILPFSGSYFDQPNKIIEVFNVLNALLLEAREREERRQSKVKNGRR